MDNYNNNEVLKINVQKAYFKALKSISCRPRSEKEIHDFLTRKKFDSDIIKVIIEKLKEENLLNDDEFVKWWIDQRQTFKGKSKYAIKRELLGKGISQEIIDKHLEESKDDFEIAQELFQKKKHKFENYKGEEYFKKVTSFLQRKGYNWDIIKKILRDSQD